METEYRNEDRKKWKSNSRRPFAGIILIVIGGLLLSREMGVEYPEWLFTWQTFLIGLGIFLGARHGFRLGGWIAPLIVGTVFLLKDFYPDIVHESYLWPCLIIFFGLWMIIKPRRQRHGWRWDEDISSNNSFEINSVFGGTKKKVMTKTFKSGEINCVFGGNDIDLSQADFENKAMIEVNVVFGGVKLIVPAHWKIQSDVTAAFGSVEDKRKNIAEVSEKTLVLTGAAVFGSIEIKSY